MKGLSKLIAGLLIIATLAIVVGAPSTPVSLRVRTTASGLAEIDLKTNGGFDSKCVSRVEFSKDKKFKSEEIYPFTIGSSTFTYGSVDFKLPGTPFDQAGGQIKEIFARHIVDCSAAEVPSVTVGSIQTMNLSKLSTRVKTSEEKFFTSLIGKTLTAATKRQRSEFISVVSPNANSGQAPEITLDLEPKTFTDKQDILLRFNAIGSKAIRYDWYMTPPTGGAATKIKNTLGIEVLNDSMGSTLLIRANIVNTKLYNNFEFKVNTTNRFGSELSSSVPVTILDGSELPTPTPTVNVIVTPTIIPTATLSPTSTVGITISPTITSTATNTRTVTRTATRTSSPTKTNTPTSTQVPVCTAPECNNGVLVCGNPSTGCPGGCGYVCITNTLTPTRTATATFTSAVITNTPTRTATPTNTQAAGLSYTSSNIWQVIPNVFPAPTGEVIGLKVAFDMSASALNSNSLTGLSLGAADAYSDLAAVVRFAPTAEGGDIDVRNGGTFSTTRTVIYAANTFYNVEINVDLLAKKYSVNIDGSPIATNFSFRTDQANVSNLDTLNIYSETGSHAIQNVDIELVRSGPVDGLCGSAHGGVSPSAPTSNLCATGSGSSVSASGNSYSWSCTGSNGGSSVSCSSTKDTSPVNGVCGSADGKRFSVAPSSNLCAVGTSSNVTRSGDFFYWSCSGLNSGSADNCSAEINDSGFVFPIAACNNLQEPVPCAMPTKENTGLLTDKSALTKQDGDVSTIQDGQVIENLWIHDGHLKISHDNVTIRNVFVDNGTVKLFDGADNFIIEHSELTNPNGRSGFNEHLVTRDGGKGIVRFIYAYKNKGDFVKPGSNQIFECNYVESLSTDLGSHSDVVQFQGGTEYKDTTFRFNNFDVGVPNCTSQQGNTQPLCTPNSGFAADSILIAGTKLTNITFECNWNLNGGNYSVSLTEGSTNFKNNIFGCDFLFGIRNDYNESNDLWCNNILSCTGQLTHPNSPSCPSSTNPTRTATPTKTPTSAGPTFTPTKTPTFTATSAGPTFTPIKTATATSTATPTRTSTVTATPTGNIPVNGICGSADGGSFSVAPSANLCSLGTPSAVTRSGNSFIWLCSGSNSGISDSCSASYNASVALKPVRVPSFGPNGTHWPEQIETPFMYDLTTPNIIDVAASWDAIRTALQNVTTNQANAGTLIRVAPGNMSGNGDGSGSTPVLENLGSLNWNKRVTVAPRDGYGSVTWTSGVRIYKVYGVAFAGFKATGISFAGNSRSALAWIKNTDYLSANGAPGQLTSQVELVEIVQPNHYVVSDDSADIYGGGGAGVKDYYLDGNYHAPRFFEFPYTGGKPHTDTFQFAAGSGGDYGNITIRDGAYFSSNNCAIQIGNIGKDSSPNNYSYGLKVIHSYVVSGSTSLSRYPHLSGGATEGTNNAFNGSGERLHAIDSVFIGGMALNTTDDPKPWANVSNTLVNKSYGDSNQPQNGAWTVDTSLNQNSKDANGKLLMPPMPNDTYLNQIWKTKWIN